MLELQCFSYPYRVWHVVCLLFNSLYAHCVWESDNRYTMSTGQVRGPENFPRNWTNVYTVLSDWSRDPVNYLPTQRNQLNRFNQLCGLICPSSCVTWHQPVLWLIAIITSCSASLDKCYCNITCTRLYTHIVYRKRNCHYGYTIVWGRNSTD